MRLMVTQEVYYQEISSQFIVVEFSYSYSGGSRQLISPIKYFAYSLLGEESNVGSDSGRVGGKERFFKI